MGVELGIIEGYYGQPWSWEMRREQVQGAAAGVVVGRHVGVDSQEMIQRGEDVLRVVPLLDRAFAPFVFGES